MPRMDGFELIEQLGPLTEHGTDVPFLYRDDDTQEHSWRISRTVAHVGKEKLSAIELAHTVGLAFLDETAVVTALRTIQHDFGATSAEVQWVMGAYLLAL